jgi:hypothetical protein
MESNSVKALRGTAVFAARGEILRIAADRLVSFDVPFLLWKGADFAVSLYPSPSMRPMSDIDLLIPLEYAGMASSLLFSAGFRRYSPGSGLFTSGIVGETKFSRGGILLELHTHPLYHPAVLPGRIPGVSELKPGRYPGGYPAPHWPETMLYTLLHHSGSPGLSRWQLNDVRLLCGRMDPSGWERFAFLAARSGWGSRMAAVLRSYGEGVPEAVLDVLGNERYKRDNGKGTGTLQAFLAVRGWRKIAFGAGIFHRAVTGRKPGREG